MSAPRKTIRSGPRLLVTDRDAGVFLEHARVRLEGGRVVYVTANDETRRSWNLPHVNLAVLYLGQGTSITDDAAAHLAQENVFLAFTGTGGSPLHLASLTTYRPTAHMRRMTPIWLDPELSLVAARSLAEDRIRTVQKLIMPAVSSAGGDAQRIEAACARFEDAAAQARDGETLLGHEGQFAKSLYGEMSRMIGMKRFVRVPGKSKEPQDEERAQVLNGLIDHGNYIAYGTAGAALHALGIPAGMSVLHGKTRAGGLVFDLADVFKDSVVMPAAILAMRHKDPESVFRPSLIRALNDEKILTQAIRSVEKMLSAAEGKISE